MLSIGHSYQGQPGSSFFACVYQQVHIGAGFTKQSLCGKFNDALLCSQLVFTGREQRKHIGNVRNHRYGKDFWNTLTLICDVRACHTLSPLLWIA